MNTIQLIGFVSRDVETRHTQQGLKVTTLSVADNTKVKGEDVVTYWRCTIFGDAFDKMLPYLNKGSAVIVDGEMQPPTLYDKKDGSGKAISMGMTVRNVRFSPFKQAKPQDQQGQQPGQYQNNPTQQQAQYAQPQQQYQQQPQYQQPQQDEGVPF
jgi:single-strand DNA-binding protein